MGLLIIVLGSSTVMMPLEVFIVCTLLFSIFLASLGLLNNFRSDVAGFGTGEEAGWLDRESKLGDSLAGEDSSRDCSCSSAAALMMLSISSLTSGLDFSVLTESESETEEAVELWCLPDSSSYHITQCILLYNIVLVILLHFQASASVYRQVISY